ncbi:unnamed protein product [Caenorhabditis sp. 36 PRJEB53466]|nr:unnamed protein product [Caenorhabditis sp. 36 PRJEB53466]
MADRQPAEASRQHQNNRAIAPRPSHTHQNHQKSSMGHGYQVKPTKRFQTESRPITNWYYESSTESRRLEAKFCQFNPLHVLSTDRIKDHEHYDCPDRTWHPAENIGKYRDFDL